MALWMPLLAKNFQKAGLSGMSMVGLEKSLAAFIDKALIRNPKDRFLDAGKLQVTIL